MTDSQKLTTDFYNNRKKMITLETPATDTDSIGFGWQSQRSQHAVFAFATDLKGIDWSEVNQVLDLGCGNGELSHYLRKSKGFTGQYTGLDLIPAHIDAAKEKFGTEKKNHFIVDNCLTYTWANRKFDIVISLGVLSVNLDYPNAIGKQTMLMAEDLIDLMVDLAKVATVLYFPGADTTTEAIRSHCNDMAFFKRVDIYTYLYKAVLSSSNKTLLGIDIDSLQGRDDTKTFAKAYWDKT